MLAQAETEMDYYTAEQLLKESHQPLAAALAFYNCWSRYQGADFVQNADEQGARADEALGECIRIAQEELSSEDRARLFAMLHVNSIYEIGDEW